MWWVFFILFLIISIFSSAALFYSLKRINQYENLMIKIQQAIKFASLKMKQVDSSGHFKSDDEVGFFFEELKNLQLMLDDIFEDTGDTENIGENDAKEKK